MGTFLDTFNRADNANVGNGWQQNEAAWSLVGGKLHAADVNLTRQIYRPQSEASLLQKVTISMLATTNGHWIVLRSRRGADASNPSCYLIGWFGADIKAYVIHADGGFAAIGGQGVIENYTTGNIYSAVATAQGSSPTALEIHVFDAAGADVGSLQLEDSTAELQSPGVTGLAGYQLFTDVYAFESRDNLLSSTVLGATSASVAKSPYNWRAVGTRLQAWNSGAYLRCYFTGSDVCRINLDQTGVLETVQVRYRVDGGVWSTQQGVTPLTPFLSVAGIVGTGDHIVEVALDATPQSSNRWSGIENLLRVVSFDVGVGTGRPATVASKRGLFYGDSIYEGIGVAGHIYTYAHLAAEHLRGLGYEVGIVACGYGGWQADVPMGVPHAFNTDGSPDWWDMVDSTTPRVAGTNWPDGTPDLILTEWGTNDSLQNIADNAVLASVAGFLVGVRAAAPISQIVIQVPVGQYKKAVLAQAASSANDAKTDLLDMGATAFAGYQVHPTEGQHVTIASVFIPALDAILPTVAPINGGTLLIDESQYAQLVADVAGAVVTAFKADLQWKSVLAAAVGRFAYAPNTGILTLYAADDSVIKTFSTTRNADGIVTARTPSD